MSEMTLQSIGDDHNALSARLGTFLRSRSGNAKVLGRQIGADPRTAESILAGHWPSARNWRGIVRAFGRDVLDAVFAPDIDAVVARLSEEERQIEERLEAVRAHRRALAGGAQHGAEVQAR